MKAVLLALACVASAPAFARDVVLNGYVACPLIIFQAQRAQRAEVIHEGYMLRMRGMATKETEAELKRAIAELVQISNTECQQLTGKFKVLETRDVRGGEAVRIAPQPGKSAWVLGPF